MFMSSFCFCGCIIFGLVAAASPQKAQHCSFLYQPRVLLLMSDVVFLFCITCIVTLNVGPFLILVYRAICLCSALVSFAVVSSGAQGASSPS